ncbi:MAG: isoprenylcysteine carboxylmethyltransferase family protein [Acidiferrobacterales bacterium]|nr:isoprenylcysteine carboxylmethyltransferase family protein [Acidiferrobacterales bacterium]
MKRVIALLYGGACYVVFFLTFLYLIGFLGNFVVPKTIDSGMAVSLEQALLINLALIALFGIQHTVMARPGFKKGWTKIVPHSVERSTYVLISSLVLIALFILWRPITIVVWDADAMWAQALGWTVFFTGIGLVLAATFVIDHFDLFGLRQVWFRFRDRPYTNPGFKVTYFYRFVRHPLYVGWILTFWGTPRMTVGHLIFAIGMTAYILVAIRYEERDLVTFLGDDYARYREKVPMLIPKLGKGHEMVRPTDRVAH